MVGPWGVPCIEEKERWGGRTEGERIKWDGKMNKRGILGFSK